MIDRVGSRGPAVLVVHVQYVGIGGEVQLLSAELAHAEDAEPGWAARAAPRWRAVHRAQATVVELYGRLECLSGEPRQIAGDLRDRRPREIAQGDAQHLRLLVAPQPAREGDRVGAEGGAKRKRLLREPGAAEQIEEPWTGGEQLGEEFRAGANADERRERLAGRRTPVAVLAGCQRADRPGERAVGFGALGAEREKLRSRQPGLCGHAGREPFCPLGVLPAGRRLRPRHLVHARESSVELPCQTRVAMLISCSSRKDVKRSHLRPSAPGSRCARWSWGPRRSGSRCSSPWPRCRARPDRRSSPPPSSWCSSPPARSSTTASHSS